MFTCKEVGLEGINTLLKLWGHLLRNFSSRTVDLNRCLLIPVPAFPFSGKHYFLMVCLKAVASADKAHPSTLQSTSVPSRVVTLVMSTWICQPAEGCLLLLTFTRKALDAGMMVGSIKVLRKVEHSDRNGEDTAVGLKKQKAY